MRAKVFCLGNNRGQILPLMPVITLVLLTMVGISLDIAFAFMTRAALNKSTDAAALSVIRNFRGFQISPLDGVSEVIPGDLQFYGNVVFHLNYNSSGARNWDFQQPGSPLPVILLTAFRDPASQEMEAFVFGRAQSRTFFMGMFGRRSIEVRALSIGRRPRMAIALVLDVSGSMSIIPMNNLKIAAKNFVDNFIHGYDFISISTFSDHGSRLTPMTTDLNSLSKGASPLIDSLVSGGSTNMYEGLWWGLAEFDPFFTSLPPGLPFVRAAVVFSDGETNTFFTGFDPSESEAICETPPFTDNAFNASKQLSWKPACMPIYKAMQMRAIGITLHAVGLNLGPNIVLYVNKVVNNPDGASGTYFHTPTNFDGLLLNAPNSTELTAFFQRIADLLLMRLTR